MAEITTIARPYAQAVFELAEAEGQLSSWSDILQLLAQIARDPQAATLLESPRVSGAQKEQLFLEVGGEQLGRAGTNLVKTLAANHRLPALPEIARLFEIQRNAAEGAVEAEMITALPVNDSQKTRVAAALQARLGREIRLECRVDASLLGGAIIRAGDLVIDGSARGKLGRLAGTLIQ